MVCSELQSLNFFLLLQDQLEGWMDLAREIVIGCLFSLLLLIPNQRKPLVMFKEFIQIRSVS